MFSILHTADWHLGRTLNNRNRDDEFTFFLNWLIDTIKQRQVACLIIAGDLFDSVNPPTPAEKLFNDFIAGLQGTCCNNIVLIAGNHDSRKQIDSLKNLYAYLNVRVVGRITSNLEDQLVVLRNHHGIAQAIVCMVPFLRYGDLLPIEGTLSNSQRDTQTIIAIKDYYRQLVDLAVIKQQSLLAEENLLVPIIGTGHLEVATDDNKNHDGKKDLYRHSTVLIDQNYFPAELDYLALGHIHLATSVTNQARFLYSGSPIYMNFSEINYRKTCNLVTFQLKEAPVNHLFTPQIELIDIPQLRRLIEITGDFSQVADYLAQYAINCPHIPTWFKVNVEEYPQGRNFVLELSLLLKNTASQIIYTTSYSYTLENAIFNDDKSTSISSINDFLTPQLVFEHKIKQLEVNQSNLLNEFGVSLESLREEFNKILQLHDLQQESANQFTVDVNDNLNNHNLSLGNEDTHS